jgi:hypothetical protein
MSVRGSREGSNRLNEISDEDISMIFPLCAIKGMTPFGASVFTDRARKVGEGIGPDVRREGISPSRLTAA